MIVLSWRWRSESEARSCDSRWLRSLTHAGSSILLEASGMEMRSIAVRPGMALEISERMRFHSWGFADPWRGQ